MLQALNARGLDHRHGHPLARATPIMPAASSTCSTAGSWSSTGARREADGQSSAVRPEPVEGPSFLCGSEEGEGFDKLSPNGLWVARFARARPRSRPRRRAGAAAIDRDHVGRRGVAAVPGGMGLFRRDRRRRHHLSFRGGRRPARGRDASKPPTTAAYRQIGAILARAGAGWDDVVDITSYHTDVTAQMPAIVAVHRRYVTAPFPAWTAIDVDRLIPERGITEIKIVARRRGRGGGSQHQGARDRDRRGAEHVAQLYDRRRPGAGQEQDLCLHQHLRPRHRPRRLPDAAPLRPLRDQLRQLAPQCGEHLPVPEPLHDPSRPARRGISR